MLHVILPLALALGGGAVGFFLRQQELATAFDAEGLAVAAPATYALAGLSLVLIVAFALLCRGGTHPPASYGAAFAAPGNWGYLLLAGLSCAPLLVAVLWGFKQELFEGRTPSIISLLLWLLAAASFFAMLAVILNNFRAKEQRYSMLPLTSAYMCCLWLVVTYQQRTSDPVVLDYVYELFAIVCTLLAFYFAAGFSFGRGKVWLCAFFCLLSVYFGLVTLADSHNWGTLLLLLFSILYQLAAVAALLYHVFVRPAALLPQEPDKTQEVQSK